MLPPAKINGATHGATSADPGAPAGTDIVTDGGQVALTQSGRVNVKGVRVVSAPLQAPPPSLPRAYYVAGDHKEIAGRSRLLTRLCIFLSEAQAKEAGRVQGILPSLG